MTNLSNFFFDLIFQNSILQQARQTVKKPSPKGSLAEFLRPQPQE